MADEGATQCGFCTPGFVMSFAGFCLDDMKPGYENVIAAVDGNICRCTGYKSIERAAAKITALLEKRDGEEPALFVTKNKILPAHFATVKNKLQSLINDEAKENSYPPAISRANDETIRVAGGTDLYVQKHDELPHADIHFVFDRNKMIRKEGNTLVIGGSVTVSDLKASGLVNEVFPHFQYYAKLVSSTPIRNMATVAGNFVNASPIGDLTIFFLALDAQLYFSTNENGERTIPLRRFYKGYKQLDKKEEEQIDRISIGIPPADSFFHFEKVSKRTHLDIASVNSAIFLKFHDGIIEDAGISAGGVGPVPLFLEKTSAFLKGKKMDDRVVTESIEIMKTEISPISDARGSKEYKTLLLGQLVRAHFMEGKSVHEKY
jgi:xanthine dehydrogenase small subunit